MSERVGDHDLEAIQYSKLLQSPELESSSGYAVREHATCLILCVEVTPQIILPSGP